MVRRCGKLFAKINSDENADIALKRAVRGKQWQDAVKETVENWTNRKKLIQESLNQHTYKTSQYKIKTIFEPKERDIYILPFYPDRIVQNMLMQVLIPIWTPMLIDDTYACISGRGQHSASRRVMQMISRNKYCLQCDIRKFYPSLHHNVLYKIVERKIKCPDTLWLLHDIIYSVPGGKMAPIGNYTSQWLGNMAMNEIDRYVKDKWHVKDYIRYCDDFLFFSNDKENLRDIQRKLPVTLENLLLLQLSKCNLFKTTQGVDFLGYRHFPDGYMLLRKRTARKVREHVAQITTSFEAGQMSDEERKCAISAIESHKGWMRWANTYNFEQSLKIDDLIWRLKNER